MITRNEPFFNFLLLHYLFPFYLPTLSISKETFSNILYFQDQPSSSPKSHNKTLSLSIPKT